MSVRTTSSRLSPRTPQSAKGQSGKAFGIQLCANISTVYASISPWPSPAALECLELASSRSVTRWIIYFYLPTARHKHNLGGTFPLQSRNLSTNGSGQLPGQQPPAILSPEEKIHGVTSKRCVVVVRYTALGTSLCCQPFLKASKYNKNTWYLLL